ncbi:MAG TPA: integrase [Ruminococcaceae bacterium]|mgnify:CR=1 FL=1|nr:integrase [Oscillospiraceae bacterium]
MVEYTKPTPEYTGRFARELSSFLDEKRRTGHKYKAESYYLGTIDRLSVQMNTDSLSKEFVDLWTQKRGTESHKTWQNRVIVIRQFARYLKAQEIPAYVTPIVIQNKRSSFVPHIYTDSELRRIFEQADRCPAYVNCPNRNHVVSLLFRMLYACGLRLSEVLNLTVADVDLENGVLSILNSKNGTNRYVPMSDELAMRCLSYIKEIYSQPMPELPFFPAPDKGKYSKRAVSKTFHQILQSAGISRSDTGPRIHDLRHTFAVNCLKKWVREGKDITAALPVLSAYLGHKTLIGTQDYLRLTAEMFPEINSAVEARFGHVIPKGGSMYEEQ